ncbi:uncharacterized protein LOC119456543 [Dermacentor silvarum]|uniref:uncharacterized protein LOC119456543 n=1 Tax=Dermacentor silvarum TaxID=543639 RepID=UPI0021013971|nr:uncharacterized protein LOC119456543 [Dermacentor silvarum]
MDGPIYFIEDSPGLFIDSSADSLRPITFGDVILGPPIIGKSGMFLACFADPVPGPTGFLCPDTNDTDNPSWTTFQHVDNSASKGMDGPIYFTEDSPRLFIDSSADSLRPITFGDVILGPPIIGKSGMTKECPVTDIRLRSSSTTDETSTTDAKDVDLSSVAQMLAELIKGQQRISQEIADIKDFHQAVKSRFDALETRVAALESLPATLPSIGNNGKVNNEIQQLQIKIDQLALRNDDLENRSRRNNLLLHGLTESPDETHDLLLSNISTWFEEQLEIKCPSIERCHRIGRRHADRPRPIIMILLDYREKTNVLKNGHKLKGSDFRISEDFSKRIRSIRKKIWEASKPFRDNGSIVHLSFDHAFINKVRYNWHDDTNTLTKVPPRPTKVTTVNP